MIHGDAHTASALAREVEACVAAVADDPEGRLALRRAFYERHPGEAGPLGRAELEFTRWMIGRGVLAPVERGGSAWWRRVQARLAFDAELASRAFARGVRTDPSPAVRSWLRFVARPEPRAWYRAHHATVVLAYADGADDLRLEPPGERLLAWRVLARMLFAQALVEGEPLGRAGAALVDPRSLSLLRWTLEIGALHPREYPARGSGGSGLARLVEGVEERVVGRRADAIAQRAAEWLGIPSVPEVLRRYAELANERT